MLFGARALQGAFGALLAPAALALLTVLFTDAKERAKAFAVYGAIAGGGVGGGPAARRRAHRVRRLALVPAGEHPDRHRGRRAWRSRSCRRAGRTVTRRYDIPGAVLVTSAWPRWSTASPGRPRTAGTPPADARLFIAVGVVLLVAFVVLELRTRNPLLPMRIVLDRNRGGAYLDLDAGRRRPVRRLPVPQLLLPAGAAATRRSRPVSRPCRSPPACSSPPVAPAGWCPGRAEAADGGRCGRSPRPGCCC